LPPNKLTTPEDNHGHDQARSSLSPDTTNDVGVFHDEIKVSAFGSKLDRSFPRRGEHDRRGADQRYMSQNVMLVGQGSFGDGGKFGNHKALAARRGGDKGV
jgi:hypothetical protein